MIQYITLAEARTRWPDPRKPFHEGMTIRDGGRLYCIRGSHYDHAVDYRRGFDPARNRKRGDEMRVQGERQIIQFAQRCDPRSWSSEPFNSQNLPRSNMKPGPYKSSTHGNITLSERGRTLLAAERDAVQGAIRASNFSVGDQSLSRARGDLAEYMSDLEYTLERNGIGMIHSRGPRAARFADQLFKDLPDTTRRHWANYPFYTIGLDLAAAEPTKEKTMNDKSEAGPAVEKSRSQQIGEATHELVAAQQALEYIENAPADAADRMSLGIVGSGILAEGVQTLVREQFAALRKKVTARAKARVSKAEKAVAALVNAS